MQSDNGPRLCIETRVKSDRKPTQWTTRFLSKVNSTHEIYFRALRDANLDALPSKFGGNENRVIHRMVVKRLDTDRAFHAPRSETGPFIDPNIFLKLA